MKEIPITARRRSNLGKGFARQSRREGHIPAVVYGPEIDPVPISVQGQEFRSAMKNASTSSILNLKVDGQENKVVLREIQRDPVTNKVTHLDFHAIPMNKPLHISIQIRYVGEPKGVKIDGGIMQTTMRELEISCLPANIPDQFEVDVNDLGIGDSIHVRDVTIPNVEILSEARRTMVVISAPTVIKSEETEAEEVEEVEGEEAPAEGEEGKPAAESAEKTDSTEKTDEAKAKKKK